MLSSEKIKYSFQEHPHRLDLSHSKKNLRVSRINIANKNF